MKKNESGITLAELLIAGVLLGVVLMAATSFLATAFKFSKGQTGSQDANAFISLEYIARSVKKANFVAVDNPGSLGPQLKLRMEKDTTVPPTAITTDDQWVFYRFIYSDNSLRTKTDTSGSEPTAVTTSDPEVVKGLSLAVSSDGTDSWFSLTDPTGTGTSIVVKVHLKTSGGSSGRVIDVTTSIIPGSMSK